MNEKIRQYLIDEAEKRCTWVNFLNEKALKEGKALKAFKASLEIPIVFFRLNETV